MKIQYVETQFLQKKSDRLASKNSMLSKAKSNLDAILMFVSDLKYTIAF